MAYAFGRYPTSRLHLGGFDASNTSRKTKMLSFLNEKNTEQNIFLHRCVNKTSSSPFDIVPSLYCAIISVLYSFSK